MPKKSDSDLPMSRRHIEIFDEDWAFLDRYYGVNSDSKIGVGPAIRHIVHQKVSQLKMKMTEMRDGRMEEK